MHTDPLQSNPALTARRAIEALRAGVPSRDAVRELGTTNTLIADRFINQLDRAMAAHTDQGEECGFVVAGDFGSGKSHLMEYLQQQALERNFAVSKIHISKETPLYDLAKVYASAIDSATVPDRVGHLLSELTVDLDVDSPQYACFFQWAQDPANIPQFFAATLLLHERVGHRDTDLELTDQILSFWSGVPMPIGDLRRALREYRLASTYKIATVPARELPLERFKFAAQLIRAAGYSGWVLLFDEVDLIGRYPFGQRARSYAQAALWTGATPGYSIPGLSTVLAVTSAFEFQILEEKNDLETVPNKLLSSPRETDQLIGAQAERGMRLLGTRHAMTIEPPSADTISTSYEQVRSIYQRAYAWSPPTTLENEEILRSGKIRDYVRRWIVSWDLLRLYPEYKPSIEVDEFSLNYDEDPELAPRSADDALERLSS